ncbi:MAG: zinc-dependent alcohol dehydrogenase family protein [Calditrichaeota bacterium]|nr:zinc-dependent alcohol dehydrogenase family protein [Calditrichota bacterium]
MKAMVLNKLTDMRENKNPLEPVDLPVPELGEKEILIKVSTCGVCHTELDEIEGRTPPPKFPVVPGHQVVGRVEKADAAVGSLKIGDRVGVAWIFSACGECQYCRAGNENLCPHFKATGRDANGGYAEYMSVPENFAYKIPDVFSDSEAAPLLCAGAVGYRSLKLTGLQDGQNLGLTGFGASGHLVMKMVKQKYPNSKIYVFARSEKEQVFSRELGAVWAGGTEDESPEKLDSIIDTTPVWKPIVEAMKNLKPGGRLVINAIRKEKVDKKALLKLDYSTHLWMEKEIKSVANVTRNDVSEFLELAAQIPIKPEFQEYSLEEANKALVELKERNGAKILRIG